MYTNSCLMLFVSVCVCILPLSLMFGDEAGGWAEELMDGWEWVEDGSLSPDSITANYCTQQIITHTFIQKIIDLGAITLIESPVHLHIHVVI